MLSLLAVFLIGSAFGAVVQRSHFCTMGAIADLVLFRSARRLRVWLLALAVAMAVTQLLAGLGLIAVTDRPEVWSPAGWLGSALGGLAFGFGMVLAGGCISRNLARLGAGSLKALLVVLLAGILAASVWHGLLAPVGEGLAMLPPGRPPAPLRGVALPGVLLAAVLAAACLADAGFRRSRRDWLAGLALGALPPLIWLLVVTPGSDPSAGTGLSFALPTAMALSGLSGGSPPGFAVLLVFGTIAGAFAMAAGSGQLRLEAFSNADDMLRHVVGGVLMGLGGGLAAGCTVGHGITGLAALAPASLLATMAMAAGAAWALRWLETGSLVPLRRTRANDA